MSHAVSPEAHRPPDAGAGLPSSDVPTAHPAATSSSTAYRLVRSAARVTPMSPSAEQRAVIDHDRGRLKVLAGPGTGKTATVVEAVADRVLRRGVDPGSIVVLTFSKRAARELSQRISARLDITVSEPIVRTLHSYAYALLRAAANLADAPAPRLLEAGQADLMVRDILTGHRDSKGAYWPSGLHPALGVTAFAAELREVMLRTAERQITPRTIAALGRRHHRPEWEAVGRFIDEYRDIGDLRTGTARLGPMLDQAELTTAALERLADPAVLAAEQQRIRRIFVDEYQDVDPAQAKLVDTLASGADELVVVGDPDQSIYRFRGAMPGALERFAADQEQPLTISHRMPPAVLAASTRIATRLPRRTRRAELTSTVSDDDALVEVRVLASAAQEAALVADEFRRAHVERGLAWSEMALLLRAPMSSGTAFRQAFDAAGVPAAVGSTRPLATDPLVAALLTVLQSGLEPKRVRSAELMGVLTSPLGGMDPLSLRRARRAMRAGRERGDVPDAGRGSAHPEVSQDLLAEVVLGRREPPEGFPADLARQLARAADLVAAARDGKNDPAAETVLWRVWQRSGMADALLAASERRGREGQRADASLDAVVELFDRAADLADQLPSAGVVGLLELLRNEHIPAPTASWEQSDAVAILSAHAAKGLEWPMVAVAGVQQDVWPDLRPRSSLLGLDELLDAAEGVSVPQPMTDRLADERRLFYVAATRASRRLLVTAVADSENAPSRLVGEIAGTDDVPTGWPSNREGMPRRGLHMPALVASMREAVCGADGARVQAAASGLARLVDAGISAADPRYWYGLLPPSTGEGAVAADGVVTLSPSQVQSAQECPLRTTMERHGGRTDRKQAQLLGMVIHALAEGMSAGATSDDLDAAVDEFLASQDHLPPWEIHRMERQIRAMREALRSWISDHADRTFLGSELAVDAWLPDDGSRRVRLRGRIDWLSADSDGRPIVTDFKTGSSRPTKDEAERHPQLASYQLALALGALAELTGLPEGGTVPGDPVALGGGELIYLKDGKLSVRTQSGQAADQRDEWVATLRDVANDVSGASLTAKVGSYCDRCPVRASCPLQPEGRQVTS